MTLTTLFALVGDDFRLWFTDKSSDIYFFIAVLVAFGLFTFELMLKSCVSDEFKYSFFFWLDFVATGTLLIDLPWAIDLVNHVVFMSPATSQTVDVTFGEPKLS